MPLPTDRPLSFSEMRDYFKANGAISLSQLYRGGDLVPDIPENSHVPTFGQISRSDLAGAYRLSNLVTRELKQTFRYSEVIQTQPQHSGHWTDTVIGMTAVGMTWVSQDWVDWSSTTDKLVTKWSNIYKQTWTDWEYDIIRTYNNKVYFNTSVDVNTFVPV